MIPGTSPLLGTTLSRSARGLLLLTLQLPTQTTDPVADLGLELEGVTALTDELPAGRAVLVAERVGRPAAFLAGLRRHRAHGAALQGPAQALVLATLPLQDPLEGARLVCAVQDDGRLAHAVLLGLPAVEGREKLAWELFLGQMCTYGSLGPADEFVQRSQAGVGPAKLDGWLAEARSSADGALVEALEQQRLTMHELTLFQRQLILSPEKLEPERFATVDTRLAGLERRAAALEPLFGAEGLADYRHELEGLRVRVGELVASDPREAPRRARGLCGSCHEHAAPAGGDWTDAAARLRGELGFPAGVLRVGYDLAPAPGDDGARSQLVADAVRAVLLATAP